MFTNKQVLVDNPNFILSTRTVIFNKKSIHFLCSTCI